jgi:redox-sensitive bicupin YhaK (pirin superfamily)
MGNEEMGPEASLAGRSIGHDFVPKDGWRMYHGDKIPGFPVHPHRGFETITIVLEGMVDHADSMGAAGRYGGGDVQWMTAGSGIQHTEMFPLLNRDKTNPLELFQIWLNLPKDDKFVDPYYTMLWNEDIPRITFTDDNNKDTVITLIAGEIDGLKALAPPPDSWASKKEANVAIMIIKMDPGAKWKIALRDNETERSLYFYRGNELRVNDTLIPSYQAIHIETGVPVEIENGGEESYILLLQGKPIHETVVQHGPFVMNSRTEIQEAFEDFHRTGFGGWPWPRPDQVHKREMGRFARYADGSEQFRPSN